MECHYLHLGDLKTKTVVLNPREDSMDALELEGSQVLSAAPTLHDTHLAHFYVPSSQKEKTASKRDDDNDLNESANGRTTVSAETVDSAFPDLNRHYAKAKLSIDTSQPSECDKPTCDQRNVGSSECLFPEQRIPCFTVDLVFELKSSLYFHPLYHS